MTMTLLTALLLAAASCSGFSAYAWIIASTKAKASIPQPPIRGHFMSSNSQKEAEKDLFDYFDPLLSPHSYPNGVSPDQRPEKERNINNESKNSFGFQLPVLGLDLIANNETIEKETETVDFDPRISPHDHSTKGSDGPREFGIQLPLSSSGSGASNTLQDKDMDVFDPTLSPHQYPRGTPAGIVGDQTRVGILLIDHGSRSALSNQRLHHLASLYQERCNDQVVVTAAHMEIAEPSILDGLRLLQKANVQEIICHPYFLSPGRHVTQDIPALIASADQELNLSRSGIALVITDPTGANTEAMLAVIDAVVRSSSMTMRA
jgi:CbiX